jgi:hypothetical protein
VIAMGAPSDGKIYRVIFSCNVRYHPRTGPLLGLLFFSEEVCRPLLVDQKIRNNP